ncbi:MAG: hypothetical protein KDC38_05350 [Planctomycetes bacterium]|nr:hypothetical protein [Planctomycetota bacterium]
MRLVAVLIVLGTIAGTCSWIVAQDGGGNGNGPKRPLDLPSGGAGDDEDDEDAPESITFYGAEYEGDAFFWCLDKSCSMGWGGEIGTLKSEMTQSIGELSARAEFSMVAFSDNNLVWSYQPRRANAGNKGNATSWVSSLQAAGGTCLGPAAVQTINIANQCSKRRRQVLILGDGVPSCSVSGNCSAVQGDINSANFQNLPVHTLYISASSDGIVCFQQIAAQNNGTFTLVN